MGQKNETTREEYAYFQGSKGNKMEHITPYASPDRPNYFTIWVVSISSNSGGPFFNFFFFLVLPPPLFLSLYHKR